MGGLFGKPKTPKPPPPPKPVRMPRQDPQEASAKRRAALANREGRRASVDLGRPSSLLAQNLSSRETLGGGGGGTGVA